MTEFQSNVMKVVQSIPAGETLSYSEVASLAGNPKAARAVGSFLAKNTDKTIPCHRVIRANGNLGKYNGLLGQTKKALLNQEKVIQDRRKRK